jgi:hypothetical protein
MDRQSGLLFMQRKVMSPPFRKGNQRAVRPAASGEAAVARGAKQSMPISPLLRPILDDDSLARNLGDCEARLLFEWLYERAERLARQSGADPSVGAKIVLLHRRIRAIAQFVYLWCEQRDRGAAGQLASAERFLWPMPTPRVDSCVLIERILQFEERAAVSHAA